MVTDTRLTRRGLLRTAAAAAAPLVVPRAVLGGPRHVAPADRITIGIIGCGKMAFDYHIPTLLGFPDVQIVAVCEVDMNRRARARQIIEQAYSQAPREYQGCGEYVDFREMLGRHEMDAVVIVTPENWHCLQIVEACRAGMDVYCEKPLTLTLAEGRICMEAVRRHKRVLQTGSQQRSNVFGQFREAVEIIRSGRLGTVKTVHVGVGGPPVPCDLPGEEMEPGLDWDLWLGPAPLRPYSSVLSPRGVHRHFPAWRNYREYAGGGHADMGAHHYDIAHWALDLDRSGPVEVIPPEDPAAVTGVRFRYAGGLEIVHGGPGGCLFTGTRGTLRIDRGVLQSDPPDLALEPLGESEVRLPRSPGHHRNWIDCIRSRERPVADVEAGARTIAVVQLGNLAYQHRRTIRWDPRAWTFADRSAPESWLDRERRDPWRLPSL